MRTLRVIGIGAGSPEHISLAAIEALNTSDAVFALDKGDKKADLLGVRQTILARHAPSLPLITVPDPPRDRHPAGTPEYHREVQRWHQARAQLLADTISSHLSDDGVGAFMVWGDPSLYDSTLRIIERMQLLGLDCEVQVYPGITAVQALTASHAILINRIGEPITITTGRQLTTALDKAVSEAETGRTAGEDSREPASEQVIAATANTVVMLDGGHAWTHPAIDSAHTYVWWGAYLGTPDEILFKGWLSDIGAELAERKAQLRADHGWIMDTYLLRYFAPGVNDSPESLRT